jgi:hypothetical protein
MILASSAFVNHGWGIKAATLFLVAARGLALTGCRLALTTARGLTSLARDRLSGPARWSKRRSADVFTG